MSQITEMLNAAIANLDAQAIAAGYTTTKCLSSGQLLWRGWVFSPWATLELGSNLDDWLESVPKVAYWKWLEERDEVASMKMGLDCDCD
jgi:hypothetical protein